jgi:hypothetical protein
MQAGTVFVVVQVLEGFFGLVDVRFTIVTVVVIVVMVVQHMGIMLGHVLAHILEIAADLAGHHMREVALSRGNRLPWKYEQQNDEQRLLHEVGLGACLVATSEQRE